MKLVYMCKQIGTLEQSRLGSLVPCLVSNCAKVDGRQSKCSCSYCFPFYHCIIFTWDKILYKRSVCLYLVTPGLPQALDLKETSVNICHKLMYFNVLCPITKISLTLYSIGSSLLALPPPYININCYPESPLFVVNLSLYSITINCI